ncbi:sugar phosphate isomerase/epimerase family protein [Mycetocola sp.]|uniref:sugar phosphate isomerase/epimerase family protein n=1 Tax=Mycetocola sp. TaxID=1871042 RepID=UPI003989F87A
MPHSRETWPIAAALHQFADPRVQHAQPEEWLKTFREVASVGFEHVDLTDNWLRIGDLDRERLRAFELMVLESGLRVPALSITRRSIIDPATGVDNLAYTHRTIDAAASVGVEVLSLGLHRPFTEAQQKQLWFWNAPGAEDPVDDPATWALAVERFRDIGRHAAENGMIVSLELYEDTYLGTADSAVRMIEDIDLPNVGLDPDIGNLVRLHRPIEDWREILAKTLPYTNYWQVKNYYRDEDPATGSIISIPAPLALGFINYREAIREALTLGFSGVFTCEHYGGDGLGVSAMNMQYLRTLLPQAQPAAAPAEATTMGVLS